MTESALSWYMGEGGGAWPPHLGALEELLQHADRESSARLQALRLMKRERASKQASQRASERRGGGGEAEGGERGTLTDDAQPRSWGRTAGSSRMAMPGWLSADGLNTGNYLRRVVVLRSSVRSRRHKGVTEGTNEGKRGWITPRQDAW